MLPCRVANLVGFHTDDAYLDVHAYSCYTVNTNLQAAENLRLPGENVTWKLQLDCGQGATLLSKLVTTRSVFISQFEHDKLKQLRVIDVVVREQCARCAIGEGGVLHQGCQQTR